MKITINAERRQETGKGAARALRRKNIIPAILYGGGKAIPLKFSKKELARFINMTAGKHVVVDIKFPDGDSRPALMKDYQVDPVSGELLHADFFEVLLTEKVKVTVPLTTTGEPIGVKRDGGILQHLLREVEVECLPDRIPSHLEIDISGLEIGQSFRVGDLKTEKDIKVLTEPQEVIVNVIAAATEEAAPLVAEPKEPEVIKKGKKEE